MNNTLIDNSNNALSMVTTLKECFANTNINTVNIATGYWDLPGLSLIADQIEAFLQREGTRLRLLIGRDPFVYASQLKDAKYKGAEYPDDYIRTDLEQLDVKEEYLHSINLLLDYCTDADDSKIQIRIFRKNEEDEAQFLHSKCYIFDGRDKSTGIGIVGSSNFTLKGLQGNAELNYMETSNQQVLSKDDSIPNSKSHYLWFEEKWALAEPWNKQFLEQVLDRTPIVKQVKKEKELLKQPFTPYELYIKLLQLKFGDVVDKNLGEQLESYLPSKMSTLNYQIEAVKRCIGIMHEHGGFMLADVVGLGKTIVGTLLIRHFLTTPEDDERERRVLIVTPPAIQSAWKKTIDDFDKEHPLKIADKIDFITTGSINNLIENDDEDIDDDLNDTGEFDNDLNDADYGLIMIDESHKFRNSETSMYKSLDNLIGEIAARTGVAPYIGLLSATPQNNSPKDLRNQLYLFERAHNNSTLKKAEGGDLEKFFTQAIKDYKNAINGANSTEEEKSKNEEVLKELSLRIRNCVLDDVLERRTRTDVEKYYKDDIEKQHIIFPVIKGPLSLSYKMEGDLPSLFAKTMDQIAPEGKDEENPHSNNRLGFYRYRAIQYFKDPKVKAKYDGRGSLDSDKIANQLARIMQMLLVKRLESSFKAFRLSLKHLRECTENMKKMWDNNTIFVCPLIDVNKELDTKEKKKSFSECVEDVRKAILKLDKAGKNKDQKNAEFTRDDFNEEYIHLLNEDYELIKYLCDEWNEIGDDPKFDEFISALSGDPKKYGDKVVPSLFDPNTNTGGKLVIFSESLDTVLDLEKALKKKGYSTLAISADNRKEKEQVIRENFDANYDGEWKNDYQVIVTTDVLAEGINLHRANVILNYDTPWNSTRLMQRIGRVNRIGSKEPAVYVYNFKPSAEGDEKIQLVRKAHTKLQSFHILFGEDSKIFSDDETVSHYALNEAVNGLESPMEKYVYELKQFKEQNPLRYRQIENTSEGWQMAQGGTGNSYFLIKAEKQASLCVKVEANTENPPRIISTTEMIEGLKVDPETPQQPLPDDWDKTCAEATKAYNQHFVKITKSNGGDKKTNALVIIKELYEGEDTSAESKKLLLNANTLVRKGQADIIKRILKIGKIIHDESGSLFKLTQTEIDVILNKEIGNMAQTVVKKQGKAEIILGTCK